MTQSLAIAIVFFLLGYLAGFSFVRWRYIRIIEDAIKMVNELKAESEKRQAQVEKMKKEVNEFRQKIS